ncbi:alpha/beta fold hydrolase [Actinacidiphila glaucinigra]|uniref:Pimeloyl-ACP methyl ester carboxylesterase n=1 Tax=Actinacidiphila glaucinigra TaxID=235986 RepID=A0A239DSG6_9ACTN|nr:alpha/beta hydrolase [Actinacidiphila glaucinigra]SNS34868.1 Pimeloyl-ACP methyl ester carboxylesterase [Actinacidiphila glaucinigra]
MDDVTTGLPSEERREGEVVTNDGVRLHYTEAGAGEPLVLIPGFAQSAAEFGPQIDGLSSGRRRVIAPDNRGHGRSGRPGHGYRIARLAMDLRNVLDALALRDVSLLAHSMGCQVVWSYWDLFGGERIARLVLVDQPPVISSIRAGAGDEAPPSAVFTPEMSEGIVAGLRGTPESAAATSRAIVGMLHGPSLPDAEVEWLVEQNRLFPPQHAAALHLDHCGSDWRDVLPRIDVPTLVIGGELSFFPPGTTEWVASLIPGARARVFSAAEGGSHLMFRENPALFNRIVAGFLDEPGTGTGSGRPG